MATWAGGWDGYFGQPYAQISAQGNISRRLARLYERRGGRVLGALAIALDGVVAGSNATATVNTVEALAATDSVAALGGKRNITTQTLINRNTTAADVTLLNAIYDGLFAPATYPVDKGRGGGGMLGTY